MTRQEKYPETKTFHYYNANPHNRITGDCTFRAIALATGKPWGAVVMEMAELSCRTGYAINDKKGIERYLEEQGWSKQKQPRTPWNTKFTGEDFCLNIKDGCFEEYKNKSIIANIGGHHIVCIKNGKVWDTWNSTDGCIGNYWVKVS